jgi:hypothetical protein
MGARLCWLGLAGLMAATFTWAPAAAQRGDPLPRFEDRLCPGIVGLKVGAAEGMVARIRSRAEQAGLRLAGEEGCEPNLIVAFIPDGQAYLQRLSSERGYMFESLGVQERRKLLAHEGPVHLLLQIRTRSRDGRPVPRRDNLVQPPQTEMWMAHSRIYTATRQDITSALMLIDPTAIGGMSIDQLGDYAAMRAFAPALPGGRTSQSGSILALFDAPTEARPAALTASDLATLKTLYEGLPNLPASARLAQAGRAAKAGAPDAE